MEKIWVSSYPDGVPPDVDLGEGPQTLIEAFTETCQKFSDRPAYTNLGTVLTYKDIQEKAQIFAAYLQQKFHVQKGTRVAIMMPNLLQYPIALFGILQAGGIVVNVNPLYTPVELAHQLNDAGAEVIIVLANFAHVLEKALSRTTIKHIIITEVGDPLPFLKRVIVNFVVKTMRKGVPYYNLPKAVSFREIFSHQSLRLNNISFNSDDIAFLQYTGGTTGIAKGAILTHKNMLANMLQVKAWAKNSLRERGEIMVAALPLYHILSLTVNFLNFFICGGLSILITNPRDMKDFINTLKKHQFTIITGVNTLFNGLLNQPEFSKLDFSHLHISLGGGMAVQKPVAEKWQKVTGKPLSEGYGLTEASPVVTVNPLELDYFTGSIGLPLPSTEISIRDENDEEVKLGEVGELWVKGPQVMQGYWNNLSETQKTLTKDGWLKTGDLVTIDEKGYIKIVDRKKDMVLVSGFNVYPNEVEGVIAACAGVLEVGVVGVPEPIVGEIVKAVIVKKDPNLTEEDIIKCCRQSLTGYKIPKKIEFRDALPKNNVGKILRRELR
jgi:long-chain acyl-CoA synthetase